MGETKNLQNQEAIARLKELAEDIKICMFCTSLGDEPFATRPMGLQDVDDAGNLWFLSSAASEKNAEIKQDDSVQLLFSKPSASRFLSVYGKASIYRDREKIEALWNPIAKAWFEQGKDDPDLTVIKVSPSDAYYWDTKDGKLFSMVKIAIAAMTGSHMDGGVQGAINV